MSIVCFSPTHSWCWLTWGTSLVMMNRTAKTNPRVCCLAWGCTSFWPTHCLKRMLHVRGELSLQVPSLFSLYIYRYSLLCLVYMSIFPAVLKWGCSSSNAAILCLPSLCMNLLRQRSFAISLAKLGYQTHIFQIIFPLCARTCFVRDLLQFPLQS